VGAVPELPRLGLQEEVEVKPRYRCGVCGGIFYTREMLDLHTRLFHPSGKAKAGGSP
jgi:hypothetical protein